MPKEVSERVYRQLARKQALGIIRQAKQQRDEMLMLETEYELPLHEAALFDKAAAIYLLARLNRPFTSWDAYKLGVIDDEGNIVKRPETNAERRSLGAFDRIILKLKTTVPKSILKVFSGISIFKLLNEETGETDEINSEAMEFALVKMFEKAEESKLFTPAEFYEWFRSIE